MSDAAEPASDSSTPSAPSAPARPVPPPPVGVAPFGVDPSSPAPPPPADALVVVERVSKWFGDLVAVSDVSFAVSPGVTALLGPNGAGKSTLLRMLCGLAAPSSGTIRVLGADPRTEPGVSAEMGVAPQQEAVFGSMTALEFVRTSAQLQGVADAAGEARRVLELVELDPDDRRRLPTYSKGMRQRVKLAQAIVHDPRVILLDEPLSGLDPRQRVRMVELFHEFADAGRAVIVSSHVLEEVERFGSNVVVISNGRLAAQGDFREIRALMNDRPRRLRIETDRPRSLAAALVTHPAIAGVHIAGEIVEVETSDTAAFAQAIAPFAVQAGARLRQVKGLDEDLESVFKYLVAR